MDRLNLVGNMEQKIMQALKYAGWYPERKTDISKIEDYYNRFDIPLNHGAKEFFSRFHGIKSRWYIEVTNLEWAADFEFALFPYPRSHAVDVVDFMYDDAQYTIKSEEYERVSELAPEDGGIVMVGEIGYYYPARVWIGESGKLYATHEYEEDVRTFHTVMELMEHELKGRNFTSVAMKC